MRDESSFIVLNARERVYKASTWYFNVPQTFKTVSKTFSRPRIKPLLRDFGEI